MNGPVRETCREGACGDVWHGEDDLFDVRSLDGLAPLPDPRAVTLVEDGLLAVPDAAEVFAASGIDADRAPGGRYDPRGEGPP